MWQSIYASDRAIEYFPTLRLYDNAKQCWKDLYRSERLRNKQMLRDTHKGTIGSIYGCKVIVSNEIIQ